MNQIERQTFVRRFVIPVSTMLLTWLACSAFIAIFAGKPAVLGGPVAYRILLNILAGGRFLLLILGSLIIYPVMFFRGASLFERLLGSIAVPIAYMIWAMVQATSFFSVGESIYYGFNSVAFGSLMFQLALISIVDIGCRWRYRSKTQESVKLVRWSHLAGIVAGSLSMYLALFWDGGVHWFYLYQEGYKLLFT
jgi:hypothetical protein